MDSVKNEGRVLPGLPSFVVIAFSIERSAFLSSSNQLCENRLWIRPSILSYVVDCSNSEVLVGMTLNVGVLDSLESRAERSLQSCLNFGGEEFLGLIQSSRGAM